jgi:PASTA domain
METLMAARLSALLPRLVALTVMWLLATSTFTFAAGKKTTPSPDPARGTAPKPEILVVPDVRQKPYVFAKGILQDAGFAWRVDGDVQGYAANTVGLQNPAPGTRVVDNGAPLVALRLVRNKGYGERGLPENDSPYQGTRVLLPSEWRERQERKAAAAAEAGAEETETAAETAPTTTESAPTTTEAASEPAEPEPRKPDFILAGAPAEPADEMPLPERARRLGERLDAAGKPTKRLVEHWLYQHAWIVTGASYGWQDGAKALRILIRVDERLQERFGLGARSEAAARKALAEVERHLR